MIHHSLPHEHTQNIDKILNIMPESPEFQKASRLFKLISDTSRLRIFWFLCHTEECVCNIASAVEMSTAAVSHHLQILQVNNLITNRRIGKEVHYTLADTENAAFVHKMVESYFHMSCPGKPGN